MATTKRKRLIKRLDQAAMAYIRERDKWTCQWCGKRVDGSNAHCSHVIPRSRGNALRWDPMNLKLLCFHCHINKWHKDPNEASRWFRFKFPERYDYLELNRHELVKLSISDLEEKLNYLEDLILEVCE